ncbi:MAG: hypothetical protein ACREV7_11525 [Steroidobacteraceae bacterium]
MSGDREELVARANGLARLLVYFEQIRVFSHHERPARLASGRPDGIMIGDS